LQTDLPRAGQALARIEECGMQAMGELTRMLRVLRDDETDHEAEQQPARQPGLTDVEGLVTSVRGAGISVDLEFAGESGQLDPSVNLTAYRVVQEALTNVTKHAGPGSRATVRIRWNDHLLVEVCNDGRGLPHKTARTLSTGNGLLGLRERVVVAGGHLEAAPTADGGFRVAATLPLSDTAAGSRPRRSPDRVAGAERVVQASDWRQAGRSW
jgi:signal transduction histidine kinase